MLGITQYDLNRSCWKDKRKYMRVLMNKRAWSPDMWTDDVLKARRDEDCKRSFTYHVLSLDWNVISSERMCHYSNPTTRHLWCISPFLLVWLQRLMGTRASSRLRLRMFCADRWLWTACRTVLGPRTTHVKTNEVPGQTLILQVIIKSMEPGSQMQKIENCTVPSIIIRDISHS